MFKVLENLKELKAINVENFNFMFTNLSKETIQQLPLKIIKIQGGTLYWFKEIWIQFGRILRNLQNLE